MGRALVGTSAAVAATAVAGGLATDPDSAWYRGLSKPPWQPPGWAYGVVWTPLYASIAVAGARVLERAGGGRRRAFAATLGADLALNAAWSALFFRLRSPRAALAGVIALDLTNAALLAQAARVDRRAGATLLPYLAWTGFATVLTAAIARRNPQGPGA
jgi:benzodiazapine receptor